jgi:hypothetical protein
VAVLSFPFEFPTEEQAAQFVRRVAKSLAPVPCLRDKTLVHVVVVVNRDIDDLIEIARTLGGRPRLR